MCVCALQNITVVFSMMSSNVTHYDANWRFQLDDPDGDYSFVKILTGGGDLVVTNHIEYITLERRITNDNNNPQLNEICQDCPLDWCSV